MSNNKFTIVDELEALAAQARAWSLQQIAEVAGTAAEALREIEALKSDKPESVAFTIPATGWTKEEPTASAAAAVYPYYYDFPVVGLTATDRASVTVADASHKTAAACGLSATNETLDPAEGDTTKTGYIRFRAVTAPTAAISAEYWIETGKE